MQQHTSRLPAAPPSPRRGGGFQLALVCGGDLAVWLGFGAILPYLPVFLTEQAHASVWLLGIIASSYYVGVFAFSSFFGHLSDRVGRKPLIVGGTALYSVATVLFLTTTDPHWFVAFRFFEGMGAAMVVPAAQAFIADITPDERRSRAYGWLTTAQYGGAIIGPAIAWPLYTLGGGHGTHAFYAIFVFGTGVTALATVALAAFLHEPSWTALHRHAAEKRPPYRRLISRPILAIVIAIAAQEFAVGGWEVIWSVWLRHLGASMTYIGLTWIAFSVPMLLSFLGGRLADRTSRYALMVWGFAVLGGSWVAFSVTHDLTLYIVLMVVGGLSYAISFPAKQALLVQISPARWLGSVEGFEQTLMQLAALIGTLVTPLLYESISGWVFAVGGLVALAGLAYARPILRTEWRCIKTTGAPSCAHAEATAAGGDAEADAGGE